MLEDAERLIAAKRLDRCDRTKFGNLGTDRIDHGVLLTDEQKTYTMEYQPALLLRRLGLVRTVCLYL
jgi:hypothetical protein